MGIFSKNKIFKKPEKLFHIRTVAFFEIIVFLLITIFISFAFYNGDRFINVSPHPFSIILLLIVVQYGRNEALMCVLMMSVFLYTGNLPEQGLDQTIYDYWLEVVARPVLWLAVATVLGGLRMRSLHEVVALKKGMDNAVKEADAITESYNKLQTIKGELEVRLAGELGSALKIYEAAKLLENPSIAFRMDALNDVILSIMNPEKFSIYDIESEGLRLISKYGWDENDKFNEIFSKNENLYVEIVAEKKVLCSVHEKDEAILFNQGILAGPLVDVSSGEVFGMLKFESIPFQSLSMKNIRVFRILCEWIGIAFHNANKLEQAESESLIDYEHMLYSHNFLNCQTEYLTFVAKYMKFNLFQLSAKVTNFNELNEEDQRNSSLCLGESIRMSIREVDQAFDIKGKGTGFAVLMPGIAESDCVDLIEHIKANIGDNWFNVDKAKYIFSIKNLYNCG